MKRLFLTTCFVLCLSLSLLCCVKADSAKHPEPDFIDHLNNSTVALVTQDLAGEYFTYCSGFWISEYYLVTARHCVDDMQGNVTKGRLIEYTTYKEFSSKFPPKQPKKTYQAVVVASRAKSDLAILKTIDDVKHGMYKIREGDVPIGTKVHVVSHPGDMDYSYITGTVSHTRMFDFRLWGSKRRFKVLQVTSLVNTGSSGAAAVDDQGRVVGIVSSLRRDVPGMTFFVHKDELLSLAKKNKIKHY